ncbi:hypothetical protein EOD39_20510 [Acipenser ruthenus]|uniref:Uncharacterized protein n=1 Tax=Acipenser ruthenus TaxID=7906 RepID=A0A444UVC5_ACIRT|nr:hypothetical protein EOD39_20510 [Acipenser ruthenus]
MKSFDVDAIAEDEYFIVGRMLAVSMVHGGPGPQFIARNLMNFGIVSDANAKDSIAENYVKWYFFDRIAAVCSK